MADVIDDEAHSAVTVVGRLGRAVDVRTLPSGDEVTTFTVVVDRPPSAARAGTRVTVDTIPCVSFRASISRRVAQWEAGQWVRAEGSLRRRFWRAGAGLGSALEVDVSKVSRLRVRP